MPVTSAGLLLIRRAATPDAPAPGLEVFIAHMGGPLWVNKRTGAWSIPKGELDGDEDPLAAARREFAEELGVAAPEGDPVDLGEFRYSSGKRVRVFVLDAPEFELDEVVSNTFDLEWPPRSGRTQAFPEIDEARWVGLDAARPMLVAGQRPVLDVLEHLVG